jgi:hypothetical protein
MANIPKLEVANVLKLEVANIPKSEVEIFRNWRWQIFRNWTWQIFRNWKWQIFPDVNLLLISSWMQFCFVLWVSKYRLLFSSFTDKRQLNSPPDASQCCVICRLSGRFGARQTTAVLITSRVYNINWLERLAGAYWSSGKRAPCIWTVPRYWRVSIKIPRCLKIKKPKYGPTFILRTLVFWDVTLSSG